MNESFFEITSALPWMVIGAFAATVLWTLLHWLFGSKRKFLADIDGLKNQLAASRSDLAVSHNANAKMQVDGEYWQAALAEATKEASKRGTMLNSLTGQHDNFKGQLNESLTTTAKLQEDVKQFQAALAEATKRAANASAAAEAANARLAQAQSEAQQAQANIAALTRAAQTAAAAPAPRVETPKFAAVPSAEAPKASELALATMRRDLDTRMTQVKNLEQEIARLKAENTAPKSDPADAGEVAKLKAQLAAATAAVATATAAAAAAASSPAGRATKAGDATLADLKRDLDLRYVEVKSLQEEVARLTGENGYLKKDQASTSEELAAARELRNALTAATSHRDALASELESRAGITLAQHEELLRLKKGGQTPPQPAAPAVVAAAPKIVAPAAAMPAAAMPASAYSAAATAAASAAPSPETRAGQYQPRPLQPNAVGSAALDDFIRIHGMTFMLEKRLNALGVTRYEQIANWTAADVSRFEQAFDIKGRIQSEQWVEKARVLASSGAVKPVDNSLPSGTSASLRPVQQNDLKRIQGITLLLENRLHTLGVTSYQQIANWTAAEVEKFGQMIDVTGRIQREQWIEQARILASGGDTKFSSQMAQGEA